jgi:hypothetical protein
MTLVRVGISFLRYHTGTVTYMFGRVIGSLVATAILFDRLCEAE